MPPEIPGEHQASHRGEVGPQHQETDVTNQAQQHREARPPAHLVQQAEEQKKTVLEAFPESEMAEEYRILAKAILMKVREKQEVSNA